MKRVVVLVIVAAMVCVSAASAANKAGTRVTLDHIEVTPGGTIWTGDIFSSKTSCKNQRRVIVFRVRDGQDQKRGSTLSYKGIAQPGYYWAYEEDGIPPAGNYYAKVRATEHCEPDRSALYRLVR
jgi:hypothetical protein